MEELDKQLVERLEAYIAKYNDVMITSQNAGDAIADFDERWKVIVDYMADYDEQHQSKYGIALVLYSVAIYESANLQLAMVTNLESLVHEYDCNDSVKYKFGVKQSLYYNLGSCWHRLGTIYDNMAVAAYKKYIYYLLTTSSNTSYRPTAYAFKKCTTFLYQALVNDRLSISSPTTFNDPFDCPIIDLLDQNDEISALILQAYKEGLKIACFASNERVPHASITGELVLKEKKRKRDKKEYLNGLLWAHYADSHHGICIKYRFCDPISHLGGDNPNVVSYFRDVKYSNRDLSSYSNKDTITLEDSFFLKGKQWEYENELRYLYYDLESKSNYGTIDIPHCIEAIYFGLKCSKEDQNTIMNIMKDKKLFIKNLDGKVLKEQPVEFYKMKMDLKHFGQLKAVNI